jgi:hypothetical protein
MPNQVIEHLNSIAARQGYTRGSTDPGLADAYESESLVPGDGDPEFTPIGGDTDAPVTTDDLVHTDQDHSLSGAAGVLDSSGSAMAPETADLATTEDSVTEPQPIDGRRYPIRSSRTPAMYSERTPADIQQGAELRSQWQDSLYAFKISVRKAMKERPQDAEPVIMKEMRQMLDKRVWHGKHMGDLTASERSSVIRSSMFLKDKYLASGAFDKFKARLVGGGDGQDKSLYDNLSSPTAATTSVFTIAAIAASENRFVETMDIGGAFLNADMKPTGVVVHMRLDKMMASILVKIAPDYHQFLNADGTIVVQLDKALYGTVEAASLWYNELKGKLEQYGFIPNPYDNCVFNISGDDGIQTTVVLHVDDLLITSASQAHLESFKLYMRSIYKEISIKQGKIIDYLGMTFDFTSNPKLSVTMEHCTDDILSNCGVTEPKKTPATSSLFNVRDAPKASAAERKWFHSYVAKMLYLAKRVRPECLTAVAFLSTRVIECDIDDLAKLRRLLGYVLGTRDRGIVFDIGDEMRVHAYIDAAYGVHSDLRSHTGCAVVLGKAGPIHCKSKKQRIVTKSSMEAEVVGLSDTASTALHLHNFVEAQGYTLKPTALHQDNMSGMAVMKKGGPVSERSRHIHIRYFWLKEQVDLGVVEIKHLGTSKMFANLLTKPVQGKQFRQERYGLTNWGCDPAQAVDGTVPLG